MVVTLLARSSLVRLSTRLLEIVVWNSSLAPFRWPCTSSALDGGVLHLSGFDLVQQVGVANIRVLCPCWSLFAPRPTRA